MHYLPAAAALLAFVSTSSAKCTQYVTSTAQGQCTGAGEPVTVTSTVTLGGGGGPVTSEPALPPSETVSSVATSSATVAPAPVPAPGGDSDDKLIGYGAGTTGGGSGSGVTVTSCSELSAALPKGGVIKVSGILSGCGVLKMASSTTILGVGANSGITKGGLAARGQTNIIVRNMKFFSAVSGGDLLAFDTTSKIWVDHCEFYNNGLTGGKDDVDGLLDLTHGCDDITISWNKFHDHWKGVLIGHSDGNAGEDTGKFHVTFHHNYWFNVNSRLPSLRFGTGHIYNSCFEEVPTSGINSRMGASVLVEGNSFTDVKNAIITNLDSKTEGSALEKNNLFLGTTNVAITKPGSLSPPYAYSVDDVNSVCATVKARAGTGIIS